MNHDRDSPPVRSSRPAFTVTHGPALTRNQQKAARKARKASKAQRGRGRSPHARECAGSLCPELLAAAMIPTWLGVP